MPWAHRRPDAAHMDDRRDHRRPEWARLHPVTRFYFLNMPSPLIFDAHLDLALNAIEWNRDLTQPLAAIRAREAHLRDKPDRGHGTVCLPELRRGGFGIVVATLIARVELGGFSPAFGWHSPAQAWAMAQAQLAWYRAMDEAG